MVVIESFVVEKGMKVRVRAVCSGQCHLGERCMGEVVTYLVSTERVEQLGFVLAMWEGVEFIFQDYARVLELLDH